MNKEYVMGFDTFLVESNNLDEMKKIKEEDEEVVVKAKKGEDEEEVTVKAKKGDDVEAEEEEAMKEFYHNSFIDLADAILESDDESIFESTEGNNDELIEAITEATQDLDDAVLEGFDIKELALKKKAKDLGKKMKKATGPAKAKLQKLYYQAMGMLYKYLGMAAKKAKKPAKAKKFGQKAGEFFNKAKKVQVKA